MLLLATAIFAWCSSSPVQCQFLHHVFDIFLWLTFSRRDQVPPIFPIFNFLLESDVSNDRVAAIKVAQVCERNSGCLNVVQYVTVIRALMLIFVLLLLAATRNQR